MLRRRESKLPAEHWQEWILKDGSSCLVPAGLITLSAGCPEFNDLL